ncbi:MAG: ABC transporter permease [Rectinemataceae bacterium]|jgi:ribose transport system permease protein
MDETRKTSMRIGMPKAFHLSESGIVIWILAVGVVFSVMSNRFLDFKNLVNIITQASVIGILAVSMTAVIVSGNGGIDLSAGSIMGISSVAMAMMIIPEAYYRDTTAMLSISSSLVTLIGAIGLALLVGSACGFINGILISLAGLPPFIATLGMMTVARGVAAYISSGIPTYGLPKAIVFIGQGRVLGLPFPILIMLVLGLIGYLVLTRTTFGMRIFAIGGNKETARFSGINVKKTLIAVYTINGLFAAIAAITLSGRNNQAHPDAGMGYEMYAIGAVVIGGTSLMGGVGGIVGSILGAIFMAEVQNGINILDIPVAFMKPILGFLIIAAVILDQWQKSRTKGG